MAKQYSTVNNAPDGSDADSIERILTILDQNTSYEGSQEILGPTSASSTLKEAKEICSESPFISSTSSSSKRGSVVRSVGRKVSFKLSPWTSEILSLGLGIGALTGIIALLAHFNGQALPNWPYDITLNTLIALMATIVNAGIAVSLQSGLSQLKWIGFKSGRRPLADFETFDEASRGSRGVFKLLATARGGVFGSLGAIIAIVSLALGPFAQQIIEYRMRTVAHPGLANIPRALNYSGALPGDSSSTGYVPILPMKSAVYNGLFAENNKPAATLPFACPTGNCTWPTYDTLAVCSECIEISSVMERYCGPDDTDGGHQNLGSCGWKVPQGAVLNSSADVFSMTPFFPFSQGDMPYATIMKLVFMGTESFCVQTLSSSVVNGSLIEDVTDIVYNSTVVDMSSSELIFDSNSNNATTEYPVYINTPSSLPYQVSMGAKLALAGWFSTLFRAGSATRSASSFNRTISSTNPDAVAVNLTVGISSGETFFDTDIVTAFYWNYYQYPSGIPLLLSDLATSMTVAFRSFTGAKGVAGMAENVESYVHVRWAFLTLPLVVVGGAALFLGCVVWRTKVVESKVWKGSALAMLSCGLDRELRRSFMGTEDMNRVRKLARGANVRLDEDDDGIWLRE
ncbi:hypothetical protein EV356DRAFT_558030 [Viridothelium virens]|uniref:DUF3176 domain-containing protein n=1 Tax=Viridothelium virens TaxID=1048519 RepID=A0A6A6HFN6_VIRVR|nr:hypothetical protein EV356DRAFT_558030 [Viridothelium virens]